MDSVLREDVHPASSGDSEELSRRLNAKVVGARQASNMNVALRYDVILGSHSPTHVCRVF